MLLYLYAHKHINIIIFQFLIEKFLKILKFLVLLVTVRFDELIVKLLFSFVSLCNAFSPSLKFISCQKLKKKNSYLTLFIFFKKTKTKKKIITNHRYIYNNKLSILTIKVASSQTNKIKKIYFFF